LSLALAAAATFSAPFAHAAALSSDARAAIPRDVQQIIVVDYRAMQSSPAAMSLKDRVLPPELKRLESALLNSGLQVNQDADALCFAAFRAPNPEGKGLEIERIVGIAQGQFRTHDIMANFTKNKTKAVTVRNSSIYPMGSTGMDVVFLNQTTMVFGDKDAVKAALDSRDGITQSFLSDSDLVNEMVVVDSHAVWSLLDAKGTQVMMKGVLGVASQLADYDTVKSQMKGSRYTMDFSNGVRFNMTVNLSNTITAATCATLLKGVQLLKKQEGTPLEKTALDDTTIDSDSGILKVDYSSSDSEFTSLLTSPLFQTVVK
jgi:predicted ribosome-associated RNA-binding protein Tma20